MWTSCTRRGSGARSRPRGACGSSSVSSSPWIGSESVPRVMKTGGVMIKTTSRVPPPTPPTVTIGSSTSTSGTPASASTRPTSTPSSSPSSRWTCHRRASTTAPDSDSPSRSACAKPWAAGCGPNPLDSAWAAHSIFASSACRYQARTARAPPRCRRCPAAFGPTRRMPSARRRLGAGFARREPPRLCPWSVPLPR